MLLRTADNLYWMARHMERAENTARLLNAQYQFSLLPKEQRSVSCQWEKVLELFELKDIYKGIERNILDSWLSWSSMDLQEIVGEEWGMLYGRKRLKDDNGNWVYYASGNHRYENNQLLGNIMPDYTGGITSNLTYKNWDLAIGIDFQEGGLYHSVTDFLVNNFTS